ncbi:anti-sigma factor domain-containing protein [Massilia sp. H6]|uniref:anti-sigma factor n=1 Tax=Massilia sp. H6 TaxID=2970464 RepID=UPI002167A477|nr:anti-sigma factor [Massilia sp. H6]UVW28080.1 anti-sigma factor [Massilia sp. H6]
MNLRDNEPLREQLAAEYVLGTLRGRARRRFEGLMHGDAALRRTVAEWRDRIGAMAEFVPAAAPRQQVWRAIQARLGLQPAAPAWQFWRHGSLGFWRGLGLATSMSAALLLVTVMQRAPEPAVSDIATLLDDKAQAALLVTADRERKLLTVRLVASAPIGPGQVLQLWAIPQQGKPRSLGLLEPGEQGSGQPLTLALTAQGIGADVALLAVSLEPKGGSPDPNGPSGPVLYKGGWIPVT